MLSLTEVKQKTNNYFTFILSGNDLVKYCRYNVDYYSKPKIPHNTKDIITTPIIVNINKKYLTNKDDKYFIDTSKQDFCLEVIDGISILEFLKGQLSSGNKIDNLNFIVVLVSNATNNQKALLYCHATENKKTYVSYIYNRFSIDKKDNKFMIKKELEHMLSALVSNEKSSLYKKFTLHYINENIISLKDFIDIIYEKISDDSLSYKDYKNEKFLTLYKIIHTMFLTYYKEFQETKNKMLSIEDVKFVFEKYYGVKK